MTFSAIPNPSHCRFSMESNMRTMLAASAGTFDGLANGMVLRHGSYSSHGAGSVHSPAAAGTAEAANGGEGFDVGPMARYAEKISHQSRIAIIYTLIY